MACRWLPLPHIGSSLTLASRWTYADGHGVCLSNGNGCGGEWTSSHYKSTSDNSVLDCFDDKDFSKRQLDAVENAKEVLRREKIHKRFENPIKIGREQ